MSSDPASDQFSRVLGSRRGSGEDEDPERALRDLGVITVPAVVAVCELCGERSAPLDPEHVESWAEQHARRHAEELMVKRMAEAGHRVRVVVEWMDQDDSSGHALCTCGWRSRSVKVCNAGGLGAGHLHELDAART